MNVPFQGGTYHGYGIHDFLHVDPRFALDPQNADNELRSLVDAAHNLGMYVILDIVLNHAGDVFAYICDPGETDCTSQDGAQADFRPAVRPVQWRDAQGNSHPEWPEIATVPNPSTDELVWPIELQKNDWFRRQGMPGPADDTLGDFSSLKQFRTDLPALQEFLIRAYQYVIARFDVDGYRIDTLRYLKNNLPLLFGNSIREFALSIGKKNFFTFGEVFVGDAEEDLARFIGRTTTNGTDMVGVDAALDYPVFFDLKPVVKGFAAPSTLANTYGVRKQIEADVLSSHGDATRYFVTFLDNHDVKERIRYVDPANPNRYDDQVTLGMACLSVCRVSPVSTTEPNKDCTEWVLIQQFVKRSGAAPVFLRTPPTTNTSQKSQRSDARVRHSATAGFTSAPSQVMGRISASPHF